MGFQYLGCLVMLVMLLRPFSCQQQPNTDGYFLYVFFQKMNLTPATTSDKQNVCSWKGVLCDDKHVYVVGFEASGLNLSGLIPDTTIGKLSKLQFLDLSNNFITGLPSDIWSLSSLTTLNLSNNLIPGTLPSNIGNFGQLRTLDLSSNNFSSQIPSSIGSLLGLETLVLGRNAFEGEVPMGIMSCKSLGTVDLSSNRLYGKLPRGFGAAFPMLKKLDIGGNKIQGRDVDFADFKSIAYLNISANCFQGSVMGIFRDSLEVMDLSKNQFSGHLSQAQSNSSFDWSHLIYLDLSGNELSGPILHNLSSARNLKHLNLACNRFSTQEFPIIQTLSALEYLNLSSTSLTNHIPVEISQLRSLNALDLSLNHLTGHIPVIGTKSLRIIDVSDNNLTGDIPISLLEKLPRMERFNFSYNNLSLCASEISSRTLKTAFIGSQNNCPIAANPVLFKTKSTSHNGLKLALALTFSLVFLLALLLCIAFCCRRRRTNWAVKQNSYNEEQNISGPFAFQTDSTTWVADVKLATVVPVVIFEKPLLNFTFADLLSATSHFERGTLLAEGRFGPVYRGFLPGGIHVAVKVLVNGSTMTDQEAATELEYLGRIKHPNLVPLTGYCLAGDQRIAIYDYMENGNLHNLLYDLPLGAQKPEDWSNDTWEEEEDGDTVIQNVGSEIILTTWRFRHKIALGTARALAFLHHGCSPPIIHRDVKASSVYLDINLEPRLSDFGLGKFFGNALESDISRASPGYTPPEFSRGPDGSPVTPTHKSDVYGFGVVLFELITGKKPVGDDYPDEKGSATTLVSWVRGLIRQNAGSRAIDPKLRGTGPEAQMEEALKFGFLCTAELPAKRPSMQQIVGLLKDIEPPVNK